MSWEQKTLGEVAEIVSGSTPKSGVPRYWDGTVAWATPTDLSRLDGKHLDKTDRTITEAGLNECSARLLPPGSVLFSSRAPIGLVAINTTPMATNQGFKSFVPRPEVNADYLYWWLRANRRQLEDLGNGATFKEVSKAVVSRVQFPLPPLTEQRRIAAILDKADTIRRKREKALRLTDDLLKAAFLKMFGDPVLNAMKWPLASLSEFEEFLTSGSRGWAQYYSKTGAKFLRIGNVGTDALLSTDIVFVNVPDNAEAKRTKVKAGDILISITADLGRTAVIPEEFGDAHINQHLALVRLRGISPIFVSAFLASQGGQDQFKKLDRVGVKSGLNFDDIRSLRIPVPPASIQKQYESVSLGVRKHRQRLILALAEDKELFASISQRAFRGEL